MTRLLALCCLALLPACGVDGPPIPPSQVPATVPEPGIAISGQAQIGVVGVSG